MTVKNTKQTMEGILLSVGITIGHLPKSKQLKEVEDHVTQQLNAEDTCRVRTTQPVFTKESMQAVKKAIKNLENHKSPRHNNLLYSAGKHFVCLAGDFPKWKKKADRLIQEYDEAVKNFLDNFDKHVQQARAARGLGFNQEDYPQKELLRLRMQAHVTATPLSVNWASVIEGLPKDVEDALVNSNERFLEDMAKGMSAFVRETVTNVSERLQRDKEEAMFLRPEAIEKLTKLADDIDKFFQGGDMPIWVLKTKKVLIKFKEQFDLDQAKADRVYAKKHGEELDKMLEDLGI